MQVEVDVKCMQANFSGHGLSGFGDLVPSSLPSKTAKFSLLTMGYIVHGGQILESARNICARDVDVECMQINYGEYDLSGFTFFHASRVLSSFI